MRAFFSTLGIIALGCGGSPEPEAPSGGGRAKLSAEECEAGGGRVIGDIGDGATQRPDYTCPAGGAPRGDIVAPPGGPIGVEGSVCCPK
jgi:hypothetical protein